MDILLFLGSGISYASSLPTVDDITDSIFNQQWYKHSNQTFFKGPHPSPYLQKENIVPRIQEFLKIIKNSSDEYLMKRRGTRTTYEDLFYICQQISDNERLEIDNPAIQLYVNKIKNDTQHLCIPLGSSPEKIDLSSLASYSLTFLNCVVHHALYTDKDPMGLSLINGLAKISSRLDIATLNHDLLIEKELANNSIEYVDGFGEQKGDVKWFEHNTYDDQSKRIFLYKLHGSINWYRFRQEIADGDHTYTIDKYGLALKRDNDHCKDEHGIYLTSLGYTPVFLTGTYNKLSAYNFGIIRSIHNKFENRFWKHKLMIMSGYGWNDRGINGRLFEWILSSSDKRLFLLHENPEEKIKNNSKSAMWHRYDDLVQEGKLIPIKKWFSDIRIDELSQKVQEST